LNSPSYPFRSFFYRRPLGKHSLLSGFNGRGKPRREEKDGLSRQLGHIFYPSILLAFAGEWILRLLRVTISSFQIAGGVLIFIIAISMLQARRSRARSTPEEEHDRLQQEDVSIFPLAIPMMSGPAAITTIMVLVNLSKSFTQRALVILAITLTSLAGYFILRESGDSFASCGRPGSTS
jgi:multiple antibiotic resistance protein